MNTNDDVDTAQPNSESQRRSKTAYFLHLTERARRLYGDSKYFYDALGERPWLSPWVIPKTTDSVLRGIGQVCFANNTFSGILILAGFLIADLKVGAAAVLCSVIAIATAKFMNQDDGEIRSGLTNFSPVLVGTVTASLYPVFFTKPFTIDIWCYMMMATVFSVCVGIGLGAMLSVHRLPGYTLPFNISTSMMFLCLRAKGYADDPIKMETQNLNVTTELLNISNSEVHDMSDYEDIQWNQVWQGTLLAASQVYAVESISLSVLVLVGIALCSPMLAIASYLGGLLATFTALAVSSSPYSLVYAGVWGYNGFLSSGCIAFFMTPSKKMVVMATINAIFTACLQAAIIPVFSLNNLPVFTYPFCLSSFLFLALTTSAGMGSSRVANPTFPEHHLALHLQEQASATRDQPESVAKNLISQPPDAKNEIV